MFYVHVVPHVVHVVNNVVHCHFAIVCNTVIPVTLRVNGSRNITVPTGPKCCRIIVTINKDGGHLVATISPERNSDHILQVAHVSIFTGFVLQPNDSISGAVLDFTT